MCGMGSVLLCIFRSSLLVYSAGSGVNAIVLFCPGNNFL